MVLDGSREKRNRTTSAVRSKKASTSTAVEVGELCGVNRLFECAEAILERLGLNRVENAVLVSVNQSRKSERNRCSLSHGHTLPGALCVARAAHDIVNFHPFTLGVFALGDTPNRMVVEGI
jgi:hypothetical protein